MLLYWEPRRSALLDEAVLQALTAVDRLFYFKYQQCVRIEQVSCAGRALLLPISSSVDRQKRVRGEEESKSLVAASLTARRGQPFLVAMPGSQ